MELELRTDDHCRIVGFPYHDGQLRGIRFLGPRTICIDVESIDAVSTTLWLNNVIDFSARELREGNTVNTMRVIPFDGLQEFERQQLRRAFCVNSSYDLRYAKTAFVFWLECSYGVELFAVVEDRTCISVVRAEHMNRDNPRQS